MSSKQENRLHFQDFWSRIVCLMYVLNITLFVFISYWSHGHGRSVISMRLVLAIISSIFKILYLQWVLTNNEFSWHWINLFHKHVKMTAWQKKKKKRELKRGCSCSPIDFCFSISSHLRVNGSSSRLDFCYLCLQDFFCFVFVF